MKSSSSEADALQRDIRARLEEAEVEIPERFAVEVELVEELPEGIGERSFDISYDRASGPSETAADEVAGAARTGGTGRLRLQQAPDQHRAARQRARPKAAAGAPQRRGLQGSADSPNSTVSRTHAHIEFDAKSGEFRIFDDHSALGTTVLREGEFVNVPKGTSKGAALRSGDEIVLGQARLAFEILGAP